LQIFKIKEPQFQLLFLIFKTKQLLDQGFETCKELTGFLKELGKNQWFRVGSLINSLIFLKTVVKNDYLIFDNHQSRIHILDPLPIGSFFENCPTCIVT